jgi:hypothetical protein
MLQAQHKNNKRQRSKKGPLSSKRNGSNKKNSRGDRTVSVTPVKTPVTDATVNMEPEGETQLLEEMNRKHAVVPIGGKTMVLTVDKDPITARTVYRFSSFADIKKRYLNRTVEKTDLGSWWLGHPQREEYDGVKFAPFSIPSNYFNFWRGWEIDSREGDCSLYLKHIHENICKGNERLYKWILAWMADAIQNPAKRPGTALVLRGKQGTGKGVFARTFGGLFGQHFLHIASQRYLTGNFNAHLQDCLLLFADEGFCAGDKSAEGVLKALITEPTLMIERKGVDPILAENYVRLIIASNHDWVIPAASEERRFCVLEVGDGHMQGQRYFQAIDDEMQRGGKEALLYYLQHFDLAASKKEGINPAVIPQTEALLEQKLYSMAPEQQWWYGRLQDGAQTSDSNTWEEENWIETQRLYDDFIQEISKSRQGWRSSPAEFGKKLSKLIPGLDRVQRTLTRKKRAWGYMFPPLQECREAFTKATGIPFDQQEESIDQQAEEDGLEITPDMMSWVQEYDEDEIDQG